MKMNFLRVVTVLVLSAVMVSSLKCWMCPGGESSFKLCDDNKVEESCKPGLTRCATFSFENTTGIRIFAKSCTSESYCSKNSSFCAGVIGGGENCRVQCCETELCNFQVGFATTTAPSTTTAIKTTTTPTPPPETTTKTTTTPPPPPETTTKKTTTPPPPPETTTKKTTTPPPPPETTAKTTTTPPPPPTEKPLNPSKDPQTGEDEEDCSWVDAAASSVTINVFTSGICLVIIAIFLSLL